MPDRHSLLLRQLRRHFSDSQTPPAEWDRFLKAVDEAYRQSDRERRMLERTLDLSSQELLQANSQMRAMFQAFPDLFFHVDRDGTILESRGGTDTDLYVTAEKTIGKRIQSIPSPEVGRKFDEAMRRAKAQRSLVEIQYALEIGGRFRHFEARCVPLHNDHVIIIVRDRTNLRETEMALRGAKEHAEAADQAKSQFLANMSHELRTPLNSVIGFANLLLRRCSDRLHDPEMDYLNRIAQNGKQLLWLINDLLDLSKVEAGKLDLRVEEVDVSKLLQEIESSIQPLVESGKNRLSVRIARDINTVPTDAVRLRQILMNLLSNASKFTQDGEISVDVSIVGGAIQFCVGDTGIGMTKEQRSKLFRPFAQADASTTRRYGGTGLGLTISLKLTRLLGGKLEVESEPGVGSTFCLELPLEIKAPALPD